jgi:hypothetical protein
LDTALEWLLGAGIVTVLFTQTFVIARSIVGSWIKTRRERKGLMRLLYTEVTQNKANIEYVAVLLGKSDEAKSALAIRGQYVSAEAWKAVRGALAQNISSKDFTVISDYYRNVLRLEEVATVERAKKDRDADHETSSATIYKAKLLLKALLKQDSEVQELIQGQVRGVAARDTLAELVEKQEPPTPDSGQNHR